MANVWNIKNALGVPNENTFSINLPNLNTKDLIFGVVYNLIESDTIQI